MVDGLRYPVDVHIAKYHLRLEKLSTLRIAIIDYKQGDCKPDNPSYGISHHILRVLQGQQAIEEHEWASMGEAYTGIACYQKKLKEERKTHAEQCEREQKDVSLKADVQHATVNLATMAIGTPPVPEGVLLVAVGTVLLAKAFISATYGRHVFKGQNITESGGSNNTPDATSLYKELLRGKRQKILQWDHSELEDVLLQARKECKYSTIILKSSFTTEGAYGTLRTGDPVEVF
jgi:hypothetical protein